MSNKRTLSTNQGLSAVNGNYAITGLEVQGIGLGIYVGVAGDVEITPLHGPADVTYTAVPQGTFMQVPNFSHIVAGGTTATDLTITYRRS
jgi:hypothetical protein